MSIPVAWLEQITDKDAFMEEIDPSWREHFPDVDLALDFYTNLNPKEFLRVVKETQ